MNKRLTLLASAILSLGMVGSASAETLKMAYDADPVSMDPQEQLSGGTLQLSHMTFDPLVRWAKDLSFEPRLAEKWERVDERAFGGPQHHVPSVRDRQNTGRMTASYAKTV